MLGAKQVFGAAFAILLIFQGLLWRYANLIDYSLWSDHVECIVTHDPCEFDITRGYGYPATPIVSPMVVLYKIFEVPPLAGIVIVMSLLISFFGACITLLTYLLRPQTLWWVGTLALLTVNRIYVYSTPPTIVAVLLVCILILISQYIYERRSGKYAYIVWGIGAGLAAATRVDTSALAIAVLFLALIPRLSWQQLTTMALTALGVFIMVDPYMWTMPVSHILDIVHKVTFHYYDKMSPSFSPKDLIFISPLGVGAFLASIVLILRRNISPVVPRALLIWIMGWTVVMCSIILSSNYQLKSYFYPMSTPWEIIGILFFITYLPQISSERINPIRYRHQVAPLVVGVTFILNALTIMNYFFTLKIEWAFMYYLGWWKYF